MKIVHIGLLSHYTEGMSYQDNIIPDINCKDGHEVTYISDVFAYNNGVLINVGEEDRYLSSHVHLIRISYDFIINEFITKKIQKVNKLKKYLEDLSPDVILYHGVCGYGLTIVANYISKHSQAIFYVDSHEDYNNTAKNIFSKIAYKYIHGYFLKKALPYIKKIFYITEETKKYLHEMYQLQDTLLEWLPLGGIIYEPNEKKKAKEKITSKLKIASDSILIGHSGKLSPEKKTDMLIRGFRKIKNNNMFLLIFGNYDQKKYPEIENLISEDKRIIFLGWLSGSDFFEALAALDIYCQPGTQSATMQNAICCGCAVISYPHPSYKTFFDGNGYYVETEDDIKKALYEVEKSPVKLEEMKVQSYIIAKKYLDYNKIAARIYQ